MMKRIALGALVAALTLAAPAIMTPALADPASCGDAPFPPEMPSAAAIMGLAPAAAESARHQAFEDVTHWQTGLKTYRGCLTTLRDQDDLKITGDRESGDKDDKDEIKSLQSDENNIAAIYNGTVDTEKRIVGGYDAVSKAYCSRKDADTSVCQQTGGKAM